MTDNTKADWLAQGYTQKMDGYGIPYWITPSGSKSMEPDHMEEYCERHHARLDGEHTKLCAALKATRQIIANKVPGQIRIAQRRVKELKEQIKNIEYSRDAYNNGGVW